MDAGSAGGERANFRFSATPTLDQMRCELVEFARDRNWGQFHTARNLMLAMVGEVGELAELFQWRSEDRCLPSSWTPAERLCLENELSDVFIYLLQLSNACRVDLPTAVRAKIAANAVKYPRPTTTGSGSRECLVRETPDGEERR